MDFFWEISDWQTGDKHLSALARAPFVRAFEHTYLSPGFYVIRGPRQVGKSSWLKWLLAHHANPKRAFYLSCENISDYKELAAVIEPLRKTRDLILLDEVTFVTEWTRAVKRFLDSGFDGTLVVTGSHAFDLRRGADRMPGRFGDGKELVLLPMSFDEFVMARADAGWPALDRVETLRRYFRCGGFPIAVIEAGAQGDDTPRARETLQRWLAGDFARIGKHEIYLRDMLGQLALTMGSTISLQTLARRTQFGSHHTALEYIKGLEDSFALRTLYALNLESLAYQYKKEKKFYFTDPLLFWLALEWAGFPIEDNKEAVLAEMVAHETLYRMTQKAKERMGYLSTQKGEVDFVGAAKWAVEVKWSAHHHNLSRAFKETALTEKIVWNFTDFMQVFPSRLQ